MSKSKAFILFFIAGASPSEEEASAAAAIGTRAFRNTLFISSGDKCERCDGVAGLVPQQYIEAGYTVVDAPVDSDANKQLPLEPPKDEDQLPDDNLPPKPTEDAPKEEAPATTPPPKVKKAGDSPAWVK